MMVMKPKDIVWLLILLIFSSLIIIPSTRIVFEDLTQNYPYIMGFIKTALLASMGERLVHRMRHGTYFGDQGIILKAIVWGLLGMVFVLIFKVFSDGVVAAQSQGLLPSVTSPTWFGALLTAFITSLLMNLFFAPTFMLLHRYTDLAIDLTGGHLKKMSKLRLNQLTEHIDLQRFIGFVILKTLPFFWIPAHTITFLLPAQYRVLMAAYLSIALGFILTIHKSNPRKEKV